MNFKKQLKEKQREIDQKEVELKDLKKNLKITKIKELEKENRSCMEECGRLRGLLEQTQLSKESQNVEDKLKQDNIQLASIVR